MMWLKTKCGNYTVNINAWLSNQMIQGYTLHFMIEFSLGITFTISFHSGTIGTDLKAVYNGSNLESRRGQWGPEEYKNSDTQRTPVQGHLNKRKEGQKRDCVPHILNAGRFWKIIIVLKYLYWFPIICSIKSRLSHLANKIFHHVFLSFSALATLSFSLLSLSPDYTKFLIVPQKHPLSPYLCTLFL